MEFAGFYEKSVQDWEKYLSDPNNTSERSGHGGGTELFDFQRASWQKATAEAMLVAYPNMVQAALDVWPAMMASQEDGHTSSPIFDIAMMAFDEDYQFYEHLRPFYERLWLESPRPHSGLHRLIALNAKGNIPVSRTEIGLLFELEQWAYVAVRVAFDKGWTDDVEELFSDFGYSTQLNVLNVVDMVEMGMSHEKGVELLKRSVPDGERKRSLIRQWERIIA